MSKNTAKNLTALGVVLLFGCQFAAGAIGENQEPNAILAVFLIVGIIAGAISFIGGLCFWAKAKGHPWFWGLTGLLCGVGGIAVLFLKDRSAAQ